MRWGWAADMSSRRLNGDPQPCHPSPRPACCSSCYRLSADRPTPRNADAAAGTLRSRRRRQVETQTHTPARVKSLFVKHGLLIPDAAPNCVRKTNRTRRLFCGFVGGRVTFRCRVRRMETSLATAASRWVVGVKRNWQPKKLRRRLQLHRRCA